jgi:hypothetical protein
MINQFCKSGRVAAWSVAVSAVLVAAGCTPKPPPVVAVQPRYYAVDLQGAAKSCKVPPLLMQDNRMTSTTMDVGNDGGWCAITVTRKDIGPYDAGLLTGRPEHGVVYVHTVGNDTRIDYTPNHGFAGPDNFTVTLLPGGAAIKVAVTVTPG